MNLFSKKNSSLRLDGCAILKYICYATVRSTRVPLFGTTSICRIWRHICMALKNKLVKGRRYDLGVYKGCFNGMLVFITDQGTSETGYASNLVREYDEKEINHQLEQWGKESESRQARHRWKITTKATGAVNYYMPNDGWCRSEEMEKIINETDWSALE